MHGDALDQNFEARKSNTYVILIEQPEDNFCRTPRYGLIIVNPANLFNKPKNLYYTLQCLYDTYIFLSTFIR